MTARSPLRVEPVDRVAWLAAAPSSLDHNYRQFWDHGHACAERLGAHVEHVAIRADDGEIEGLAAVRSRSIPLLGGGIAYVSAGPLVRRGDDGDVDRLRNAVAALREEFVERRGMVLRIVSAAAPVVWRDHQAHVFSAAGFEALEPEDACGLIDLAPPLDALRAGLKQKWRNCLNHAERNELTLRVGEDAPTLEAFCRIFDEMVARKGFAIAVHPRLVLPGPDSAAEERFRIALVEKEGAVVAGQITATAGDTCVYVHGATSSAALKLKASYLLQWDALTAARSAACRWYDVAGIDPANDPGVAHFKRGLAGDEVVPAGPFEARPRSLGGALSLAAERLYRRFRDR